MDLRIINPGYEIRCAQCGEYAPGVILRKVGDVRQFTTLCGRCLALAMQEITKQNWLSQYILWQANGKLSREIQEEKLRAKIERENSNRDSD